MKFNISKTVQGFPLEDYLWGIFNSRLLFSGNFEGGGCDGGGQNHGKPGGSPVPSLEKIRCYVVCHNTEHLVQPKCKYCSFQMYESHNIMSPLCDMTQIPDNKMLT